MKEVHPQTHWWGITGWKELSSQDVTHVSPQTSSHKNAPAHQVLSVQSFPRLPYSPAIIFPTENPPPSLNSWSLPIKQLRKFSSFCHARQAFLHTSYTAYNNNLTEDLWVARLLLENGLINIYVLIHTYVYVINMEETSILLKMLWSSTKELFNLEIGKHIGHGKPKFAYV